MTTFLSHGRHDKTAIASSHRAVMAKSIPASNARVVAVCASAGGIPKRPLLEADVRIEGIRGDLHAHEKHNRPDRALSLFDVEILWQLAEEGFSLEPGTAGENITVAGLNLQNLPSGTLLQIGNVVIRLEAPRKPCYVLDVIDPQLKEAMAGRCGYMASVIQSGSVRPGMTIRRIEGINEIGHSPGKYFVPIRRECAHKRT